MKPRTMKVWIHQVQACIALAVSAGTPAKAFESA